MTNSRAQIEHHNGKSFGLETTIPVSVDGLHFYYAPRRLRPFNVGWLFPAGTWSRLGLASYLGHTQLNETLSEFSRDDFGYATRPDGRHGGYFPYRLNAMGT